MSETCIAQPSLGVEIKLHLIITFLFVNNILEKPGSFLSFDNLNYLNFFFLDPSSTGGKTAVTTLGMTATNMTGRATFRANAIT